MPSHTESDLPPIPIIDSLEPYGERTQAWLVDIWGVMHNGVEPFAGAVRACMRFREAGGCVVLLSNSPRPRDGVAEQLNQIGVSFDAWDTIVTSGDATRELIHMLGDTPIYHLGPERDRPIFDGLDVQLVAPQDAGAIVCTGLFDDTKETPEDYEEVLMHLADREMPMICANPDVKVERGDKVIYCAGALAQIYAQAGGEVSYAGKPYLPVYHMAFSRIEQLIGAAPDLSQMLAIGDGVHTDIAGAANAGVPAIYVASGVHLDDRNGLDATTLDALFPEAETRPVAAMNDVRW